MKIKTANSKDSFQFVPEKSIFPGQYEHFQFGKTREQRDERDER